MRLESTSFLQVTLWWIWVPVVSLILVVVMAMACAVWSPIYMRGRWYGHREFREMSVPLSLRQYDNDFSTGVVATGFGVSFYHLSDEGLRGGAEPYMKTTYYYQVGRAGFPFRCLRWTSGFSVPPPEVSRWAEGIMTDYRTSVMNLPRRIPLVPEFAGLLLNVLIYCLPVHVARAGLRRAIARRRRRKGLCARCTYPVVPRADRCPECGQAYRRAKETEASHA